MGLADTQCGVARLAATICPRLAWNSASYTSHPLTPEEDPGKAEPQPGKCTSPHHLKSLASQHTGSRFKDSPLSKRAERWRYIPCQVAGSPFKHPFLAPKTRSRSRSKKSTHISTDLGPWAPPPGKVLASQSNQSALGSRYTVCTPRFKYLVRNDLGQDVRHWGHLQPIIYHRLDGGGELVCTSPWVPGILRLACTTGLCGRTLSSVPGTVGLCMLWLSVPPTTA